MDTPEKFTVEQWLEEIRQAESTTTKSSGESVAEIVKRTGLTHKSVYNLLHEANRLGRLKVSRRSSTGLDGRRVHTPVYSFLPVQRKK